MESLEKFSVNRKVRETPPGILRLDFGKPRCLSAEFKFHQGEPSSPQPSVDRLSVTFADESARSDSSTRINYYSPLSVKMDIVNTHPTNTDGEDSDQEDYSASANAIIQKSASIRKSKKRNRRTSSPFSPDIVPGTENGRRASVFTTSSGDTAITMDENLAIEATQDEILENIKLHKEVLSNVRMQPWNMRKKLKLVVQAKAYIKKHEGVLQERLAKSHSTRDMLARWNILLIKRWQKFRRELLNLSKWFIPWELKIKEIESHFGSVVASYFIFLRWLFWVNIVISIALISFVTIPEFLIADPEKAKDQKFVLEEEKYNATNFMTLWEFDGVLQYTPLFYGWYSSSESGGYKIPLAYFMTGLVVYGYSFVATLKKMAENSRTSKLSEKDDECIFTWKLFTAWDYMIGNAETAHNRVASIVMGFKEALLEEAEKKKDTRNWRVICIRVLMNIVVMGLLAISVYVVVLVVRRSTNVKSNATFWRKNEISIVLPLLTFVFPMIFEVLGIFEQYHPRKQLRLQLARIMVLNLVTLYSLVFALVDKIGDMTAELEVFKNLTRISNKTSMPQINSTIATSCMWVCNDTRQKLISANLISELALHSTNFPLLDMITNITTFMISNITSTFSESAIDVDFLNNSLSHFVYNAIEEKILSTINATMENITVISYQDFNYTDLEYKFADYLTYLLYSLQDDNTTMLNNDNSTEVNDNVTSMSWDLFSSTVFPFLSTQSNTDNIFTIDSNSTASSDSTDIGRFDYDLSTVFDFSSTTLPEDTTTETSNCITKCDVINSTEDIEKGLNYTMKARLRNLCWETMFGQELINITVMDLVVTILPVLGMDFFRGVFVRVMNRCWCWDLEKKFPKYGDFKVAENILSLVNNQGMVWMGMFFCPGLVLLNSIKLLITMYFKTWSVMTCNVPPEVIFRASRSNNFYYYLLLMMLFLCVLPVGYTIVWIKPSWHCGPFSTYERIFHIFTETIKSNVPEMFQRALDYIASPGIVIPLLVLLILIIYYLLSLTNSLREANEDLKIQLRRERTEERRKMFQLADRRRRGGSGESNELSNTPFNKWKKLIGNLPSGKSLDDTPKLETDDLQNKDERIENKGKDFFSKLIKRALRKSSTSEDDGTDNEQHDSLPFDNLTAKTVSKDARPSFSWGTSDFQNVARKALQLKKSKPEIQYSQSIELAEPKHVQIKEEAVITERDSDINRNFPIREILTGNVPSTSKNKCSTSTEDTNTTKNGKILTRSEPSVFKNICSTSSEDTKTTKNGKILTRNESSTSTNIWSTSTEDTNTVKNSKVLTRTEPYTSENICSTSTEDTSTSKKWKILTRNEPSTSKSICSTSPEDTNTTKNIISTIADANTSKNIITTTEDAHTTKNTFSTNEDANTNEPTKKDIRQDSESSIWSDGIPVITISETESSENILNSCDDPNRLDENIRETNEQFKAKIKCVLKKQTTEIDEDTIIYFNDDIEKNILIANIIKTVAEEETDSLSEVLKPNDQIDEDTLTDKSSSEETEQKDNSTDTILRSPIDPDDDS